MSMIKQADHALPITIHDVTKTYGNVYALKHVDLDIKSGEFMTLLGPSGSGKTTLLMVLAGFTRPDFGSIRFGDDEIIRMPPHKRNVGMVFQNYALFPHMSVSENVGFPLKLRKVDKSSMSTRIEQALDLVELSGFGSRHIDQLSGGQKQRVALARAIVFEPRILLMDEPLSALDKKLREHMQIELRKLHEKLGMTTVYVTHDQREALTMSDRIAVINHGELMQLDTPESIYNHPKSKFIADFIGESTFLDVSVRGGNVFYSRQQLNINQEVDEQKSYQLMIRPERLQIKNGSCPPSSNLLNGIVEDIVYQGDSMLVTVRVDGQNLINIRTSTKEFETENSAAIGDSVVMALDVDDTVLIEI